MKICFNLFPPTSKLIVIVVSMLLILSYTRLKADNNINNYNKIEVTFTQMPNNDLNIRINAVTAKELDLYFFSTEGKLVDHIKTLTQKTTIVKNLKRGSYLYQFFEKDKELKSGELVFK
jgi:hypothetical protein